MTEQTKKWLNSAIAVAVLLSFLVVAANYGEIKAPIYAYVALCVVNLFAFFGSIGLLKSVASNRK